MSRLFAALIFLAGCATTPAAPDFSGSYVNTHAVRMFNGDPDTTAQDTLEVGRTRGGRAKFSIELIFSNGHTCSLSDAAAMVTAQGLVFTTKDTTNGERFTLALDIVDAVATLRVVEGNGLTYCGMRGRWPTGYALRRGHGPIQSPRTP